MHSKVPQTARLDPSLPPPTAMPTPAPGMLHRWSNVLDLAGPGRGLRHGTIGAARLAARSLTRLPGDRQRRGAWWELDASLAAFQVVKHAERVLERRGCAAALPPAPLDAVVQRRRFSRPGRTGTLGPTHALWAIEGLGMALGSRALRGGAELSAVVPALEPVPTVTKLALQAGLAMACALHVLAESADVPPVRAPLPAFWHHLRGAIPAGGQGRAIEALGMVARLHFQGRIAELDRELATSAPALVAPFWHGVGRGLYFSFPRAFDRGGRWRAMEYLRTEPPHAVGRRNAHSGFAWPWLLVNFHQPRWICAALARQSAAIGDPEAFTAGAVCVLLVRQAWTGHVDRELAGFLGHRPPPDEQRSWERHVVGPARSLLEPCSDLLLQHRRFTVVFQHQELDRLPALLAAAPDGGYSERSESDV